MFEILCAEEDDIDILPEWGVKQKNPRKGFLGLDSIRTLVRSANYIIPTLESGGEQ